MKQKDHTNHNLQTPPSEQLVSLYKQLLFPRLIEEKMLIYLRQGRISKWFSGIGQEAISVGITAALHEQDTIFPMHRNLGVFTTRNIPLSKLYQQWQGKMEGFTKGRDRSFHFGSLEYNIVGMISHLGPQLSLANGVAYANLLDQNNQIAVAFSGEGATSEGEFHEALNVASVWKLPVIFVVENNGYGLSTPTSEQFNCEKIADKGPGYGMRSLSIDGNNLLEVYQTVSKLATEIRQHPEPILLECNTFRRRGHEEASGVKYVPAELIAAWEEKDPIEQFKSYLLDQNILFQDELDLIQNELKSIIQIELEKGDQGTSPTFSSKELEDVYAPYTYTPEVSTKSKKDMRLVDAISDGLKQAMKTHPNLVLMGQDIADYGGVFKITEGFKERFGAQRVKNTPICESAIVGAGLGLALSGKKAMVEMQFADFVSCAITQIMNNAAKMHYRWGAKADIVIRMPTGASVGAGPFHSQSNEAWFFHTPGLKVVYPSTPEMAKGLLIESFNDPNPIIFFEHKALYRSISEPVPKGIYTVEIGKARQVSKGNEISIITYGLGVHWALQVEKEYSNHSFDILDLQTLLPLDKNAIFESVKRTGKVLVLHEDNLTGGIGGEISALISEHCFEYLDAPVMRCASLDMPIPFSKQLENEYLANSNLHTILSKLIAY